MPANEQVEPAPTVEELAAVMGRASGLDSPHPVAYLSTEPRKWDQCRVKPQGSFTVPVYTRNEPQYEYKEAGAINGTPLYMRYPK